MKAQVVIIIICFIILSVPNVSGQDEKARYRIVTNDGNEYVGEIVREDSLNVILLTENMGEINIPRAIIQSSDYLDPSTIVKGKIWYPNLQASRYFFSPNGYGLQKGEAYYQNVWILYNQLSIGVTDFFSVGLGVIPLFLFAGAPTPVWIIPKVSIPVVKNKFNLGAGAVVGTVLGEKETGFGLVYGLATGGSRNSNISIGVGYGYLSGDWAKKPVINISGFTRVSPRTYLMSENYIITANGETFALISFGARSLIHRIGIDYGLFIPLATGTDGAIAVPWFGITIPLHKKSKDIQQDVH